MAVNMDNIASALVYDYLLKIDSSMANVFRKKIKVPDLLNASPKLLDIVRIHQETNKKRVEIRVATESSDDSSSDSDDSSEKVAKPKSVINGTTEFNGKNATVNNSDSDDSGVLPQRNVTTKLVSLSPQKVANKPIVQNQKDPKSATPAKAAKQASSSSEDSSSEDEDNNGVLPQRNVTTKLVSLPPQKVAKKPAVQNQKDIKSVTPAKAAKQASSSSEDSSSEDEDNNGVLPQRNVTTKLVSLSPQKVAQKPTVQNQKDPKSATPAKAAKQASSSSEDSSSEDEYNNGKRNVTTGKQPTTIKKSSSEDSSSEEDEPTKPIMPTKSAAASKTLVKVQKSESSSEDSSSEDDKPATLGKIPVKNVVKKSSSDDSSSEDKEAAVIKKKKDSSNDDSSFEGEIITNTSHIAKPTTTPKKVQSSSDDSSSEEDERVKKTITSIKSTAIVKQPEPSSDSSSEENVPVKHISKAPAVKKPESSESSDSSEDEKPSAPVKSAPKRKLENKSIAVPIKKKFPTKSSSDSDDSSDDSASKIKVIKSPTKSDSSEEESSDEDKAIQPTVQKSTLAKKPESTSDESSSEDEAPTPVAVKKTPSYGNFVKAGNDQSPSTPKMSGQQLPKKMNGKGQTSAGKTPFRRVREDDVVIDDRVKNNSFEAKKSDSNQRGRGRYSFGRYDRGGVKFKKFGEGVSSYGGFRGGRGRGFNNGGGNTGGSRGGRNGGRGNIRGGRSRGVATFDRNFESNQNRKIKFDD